MRGMMIAGAMALAGAGTYAWAPWSEPNVYAMSAADVHERLANAPFGQRGRSPFADFETAIRAESPERILYAARGSHAAYFCALTLSAVEAGRTRVDVSCDGGSPSAFLTAAAGIAFARNSVIELIDATLTGRPYDRELARGATASWWPDDVRDHPGAIELLNGRR